MKTKSNFLLAALVAFMCSCTSVHSQISTAAVTGTMTAKYVPVALAKNKVGNSTIYNNGNKVGIGTTTLPGYFNINHTNDGVDLINCSSDGNVIFSARRSNINTLANTHTFDGAGGADFIFKGATNPQIILQQYDLGTTLTISGSIPRFLTTRPAMEIETPLLGIGTFASYQDIAGKAHIKGDGGTTVSLYVENGYIILKDLPTVTTGLISGTLWNNAGLLSIVP
jgi:hypothetical protein